MTQHCSIANCGKISRTRGLCTMHNSRLSRTGRTDLRTPSERFWSGVDKTGACWLWTGRSTADGYGRFYVDHRYQMAHRFAWIEVAGPIPEGMQLDHKCHTPKCVNPDHLRVVDCARNRQNHQGPTAISTTGVRGVFLNRSGNFVVRVGLFGVRHHGGTFKTLTEAESVAVAMRNELHTHNDRDRSAA